VEFPREIMIDQDEHGAPRVTIDGQPLPWYTAGIIVPPPSRDQMPTVVLTIPAERVVMVNEIQPPAAKESGPPYRCSHRGCLGQHSTPNETCC